MTSPLAHSARIFAELRERLKAAYSLEDGDEALETTLEGATGLPEMLAAMVRKAKRAEGYAKVCCEIASDNLASAAAYEKQKDALRNAVAWALEESGLKKLPKDAAPEFIAYVTESDAPLEIPDEKIVPRDYCRVREQLSPNKTLIREKLEAGERFNWATLGVRRPVLTVRTR